MCSFAISVCCNCVHNGTSTRVALVRIEGCCSCSCTFIARSFSPVPERRPAQRSSPGAENGAGKQSRSGDRRREAVPERRPAREAVPKWRPAQGSSPGEVTGAGKQSRSGDRRREAVPERRLAQISSPGAENGAGKQSQSRDQHGGSRSGVEAGTVKRVPERRPAQGKQVPAWRLAQGDKFWRKPTLEQLRASAGQTGALERSRDGCWTGEWHGWSDCVWTPLC
ncbi:uncharacterized protein LOC125484065 [Rhincodon typus]|uniref:uncharacterized protein LOC125484065 n=1 Tax=Rhincodon typus TaxID=259920 RepID=UPI0020305261|nr:uncharacterized protein LOC125484065 [Rhincodon typus]